MANLAAKKGRNFCSLFDLVVETNFFVSNKQNPFCPYKRKKQSIKIENLLVYIGDITWYFLQRKTYSFLKQFLLSLLAIYKPNL